ncbi:RNA-guided endonuclease InsQ/TnpB family protein [Cryptosporangium sp. NPDC048952]|uniref:RNA-guided endonuclease InsQ/TnpB family protein n=1 Tax=Cryptosporangium sp. NPDC048952 TaxID=3363961 RepID=UPI00371F953A
MSRFRLYPTSGQEALLAEHCRHARFVWNLGLEQRLMWRRERGPTPGYHGQAAQLTEARRAEPWLAAGSQTVQQQALRDLDRAWTNFFAGTHGRPTWRRRGQHEGFRIVGPQASRFRQDNRRRSSVLIPKVGWVALRQTRELPVAKSYRITCDRSGRWHIAFAAVPDPISGPGTGDVVGIDRGVTVAAALSTGELTSPNGLRPKESERLHRLQRRFARAQRGSNRREAVRLCIARIKARHADRRKDWIEKTTTDLARRFDVIHVENLNVKAMTRSARGTAAAPGRNVRQKAGLNRGILAAGWGLLLARLEHKAPGRVVKTNPAYTSLTCNACGHCATDNCKSQAVFRCCACGHQANADVNAARNIAEGKTAVGRTVAARGDRAKSARSAKREPQLATSSRDRQ